MHLKETATACDSDTMLGVVRGVALLKRKSPLSNSNSDDVVHAWQTNDFFSTRHAATWGALEIRLPNSLGFRNELVIETYTLTSLFSPLPPA
jgi:hypothetical protein